MRLRRFCPDCGNKFIPTGKFDKYCEKCHYNRVGGRKKRFRYSFLSKDKTGENQ